MNLEEAHHVQEQAPKLHEYLRQVHHLEKVVINSCLDQTRAAPWWWSRVSRARGGAYSKLGSAPHATCKRASIVPAAQPGPTIFVLAAIVSANGPLMCACGIARR